MFTPSVDSKLTATSIQLIEAAATASRQPGLNAFTGSVGIAAPIGEDLLVAQLKAVHQLQQQQEQQAQQKLKL